MRLSRSIELHWQEEVIDRWLNIPGLPDDARNGLLEMLSDIQEEMHNFSNGKRSVAPLSANDRPNCC